MTSSTASGAYTFAGTATATRPANAQAAGTFTWTGDAVGVSTKHANASGTFTWTFIDSKAENGVFLPPDSRWRIIVQELRGARGIVTYDLNVTNLRITRALSGPFDLQCDVNPNDPSTAGIYFKPWRQIIHVEKIMLGKRRVWGSAIVQPSDVDENTGILHLKAKGFSCYPRGIPWLEDLNWLANDAYRPVVEIWRHLQNDFPNGNLGVEVYPTTSGVEMLPGYAFDGDLLNLNFFATFVRQTDRLDCGDYIDALARDVPFDYVEQSAWNTDRTDVVKKIKLGYPRLGVIQENLAFILNENVISAKPHTESQVDWVSDVGITGYFPGVEYSTRLANADPDRLRRYLDEDTAFIDSNERSAAWAHRRLARRQTPPYWETITILPNHPNAPLGSFDVGDSIIVKGNMPWVGEVAQYHKVIAITVDTEKGVVQLTLKAEGAFNYDPIFFPSGVTNIIFNSAFDLNLNGWTPTGPGWSHDDAQGANRLGSATVHADGGHHDLITQPYGLAPFQIFPMGVSVKCANGVSSGGAVQLVAQFYDEDDNPTTAFLVGAVSGNGQIPWTRLAGNLLAPTGAASVAMRLHVDAAMTAGQVWFDDAVIQI